MYGDRTGWAAARRDGSGNTASIARAIADRHVSVVGLIGIDLS
jgi:hypothetical protein